jgi:hypothetical protein
MTFNSGISFDKIIRAMYDEEHRIKWDKDTLAHYSNKPTTHKNVFLSNMIIKSKLNFSQKAFYEKRSFFSHPQKDNTQALYCYISGNGTYLTDFPDANEHKVTTDKCDTITCVQKFYRRQDRKIVYECMS